jgi:hypothetical protein
MDLLHRRVSWAVSQERVGKMKMYTSFWLENLKERDRFECLGLRWRIACRKGIGYEGVDLIHLVQGRYQRHNIANMIRENEGLLTLGLIR